MKEKIYTIPVNEAFDQDCECPLCLLESRLENEYIDYYLGPSLMEPDCRIDTNKKGFCRRHYEQLYNRQENRLGLGLVTDTHIREQLGKIREAGKALMDAANDPKASGSLLGSLAGKLGVKGQAGTGPSAKLIELLDGLEKSCTICGRLDYTMDRYLDVTMYLWSKEEEFRKKFSEKKAFAWYILKCSSWQQKNILVPMSAENFSVYCWSSRWRTWTGSKGSWNGSPKSSTTGITTPPGAIPRTLSREAFKS
jgi:hypothetical protein